VNIIIGLQNQQEQQQWHYFQVASFKAKWGSICTIGFNNKKTSSSGKTKLHTFFRYYKDSKENDASNSSSIYGRVFAAAGTCLRSRCLATLGVAAARVQSRVWSSGICGGQSGVGAGFLRVLRFPLSIFILPIAPQSPSPIIWGWYNRPEVAAVQGT
jgi:hypothetical protein